MAVSYLAVSMLLAAPHAPAAAVQDARPSSSDLDALYRDRDHAASAAAAERGWAARVAADPRDFDSAWRLARARYWLGTNGPGDEDERKRVLEAGIEAGRLAAEARPDSPAGYFWMAANMGALADAHGLRQGMKYRGRIKDALERALALDPSYLDGSPDRALGRWYFKVPRLFGGDLRRSEEHLRKSLAYKSDSIITLLFLGETLLARDRRAEARDVLQRAVGATPDPEWAPEDARFQAEARTLLASIRQ
ncbi:MAG: TRAP transporter TatT component family protein [Vicinamibacterales bacterium]